MADDARVRRHDIEDAVHEGGPEVAPFARVAGGVVRAEGPVVHRAFLRGAGRFAIILIKEWQLRTSHPHQ